MIFYLIHHIYLQRKFIVYLIEEYNKEKELEQEVELIRDKAA